MPKPRAGSTETGEQRLARVKAMPPINRLLYWVEERHKIYLKRKRGEPKPWTVDPILQQFFFTNPYRENDKVTVWFRENIRGPLRDDPAVMFATVAFRWFNLPATAEVLMDGPILSDNSSGCLLLNWDEEEAVKRLKEANQRGPVFTGAYMIKAGNGEAGCKIPNVCKGVTAVWEERERLVNCCLQEKSLEAFTRELSTFMYLGGFMGYEVASDLRWTYLLEDAHDILTWANPGPGAQRGLLRLNGGKPGLDHRGNVKRHVYVDDAVDKIREVMDIMNARLNEQGPKMPRFEMREAEHSLCEFDKYERALWQDGGKMKRRYDGC